MNDFFRHLKIGRIFFSALGLLLLGLSQLVFGWIGSGFLYRVVYPAALILAAIGLFWAARVELDDSE